MYSIEQQGGQLAAISWEKNQKERRTEYVGKIDIFRFLAQITMLAQSIFSAFFGSLISTVRFIIFLFFFLKNISNDIAGKKYKSIVMGDYSQKKKKTVTPRVYYWSCC